MTLKEITLIIDAYNQQEESRIQEQAVLIYNLAALMGVSFAANNPLCNGKVKYPSIHEVFPALFTEQKPQQQDWRIAKDRLLRFSEAHNKKRGG